MDKFEEFTSHYQGDNTERKRTREDNGGGGGGAGEAGANVQWSESNKKPRKSAFGDPAGMRHFAAEGAHANAAGADDDEDDLNDQDYTPGSDSSSDDDAAFFENLDNLREKMAKDGVDVDDDAEFDDSELMERLGNLDDAGQSEHHSFHEHADRARGGGGGGGGDTGRGHSRARPRARYNETNLPPGCDRGEAVDKGEGNAKLDKLLRFTGYDLAMTSKLCGEDIQHDPREIQLIQRVDRRLTKRIKGPQPNGANKDGSEDSSEDSSVFGKPGNENYVVARNRCNICRHAGLPNSDSRGATMNAYWKMIEYDLLKYGYAPDEAIFQDMADVFNREQQKVRKSGGDVFYVTVEDVRNHMTWHNVSNPMRIPGRQLIMCNEIIRECRDQLFGTTPMPDGSTRRIVHRDNLKTMHLFMKHSLLVNREFTLLRSQVNESLQSGRFSAGAGARSGPSKSGASRHLSSGPTNKPLK